MASSDLALLTLLLPLGSAALIALFLRRRGTIASVISVVACLGVAAAGLKLSLGADRFDISWEWLQLDTLRIAIGIKFDDLSALMLAIVCIVGLCVHVFSLGYMHDDNSKARYFGGLSIFMFSMLGIVFADNLFMMFIFWELVGFSSYLLINHYHEKQSAADASKKAFIVNRVGDFGFILGIVWCYHTLGTASLTEITQQVSSGGVIAAGIPLLLFCGAVGKSAQAPLHVWLPDAMEGPTPVSALIHAATMVAAGIFMLCRIEPLFAAAPVALNVVLWVGVVTAVYAALCAVVQNDIKKVLAYSTLSQLGYMVAAFGLGRLDVSAHDGGTAAHVAQAGMGAAMFHLMTHAFFKALMFLGSGSVIYACHHEQDILKMGGLGRKLRLTFWTFTIGVAAIIGMPGLSGFFSKDAILYLAFEKHTGVFILLAFTAVLTAFYMTRLWKLTFLGTPRSENASHAHEGGWSMKGPLLVLAVLSIAGAYGILDWKHFEAVFKHVPEAHGSAHWIVFAVSVAVMALGAGAALLLYRSEERDTLSTTVPGLHGALSLAKGAPDNVYDYYVAKVQQRFALVLNFIDQIFIGGVLVRGLAAVTGGLGMLARWLHVGSLHAYVYWFLVGAAFVWAYVAGVF
ncbi:MAG: NADH-quinone oxidoreductase subunit L [Opitutaceae bacterium]|nr:NADH-quinone oxidoreductase subunit L [Opitutaceae bacterium]